jgi:hypothetical protein
MGELRRLIFWVVVLTFLGGVGTGAWVGTLMAAPERTEFTIDRRVSDFQRYFELSASQVRRLRQVIAEHDARVRDIRAELSDEQFLRQLQTEQESRERIRGILTEEQQREYDKLLRRD